MNRNTILALITALMLFAISTGDLIAEFSHDECEEGCEKASQTCHDCIHSLPKPYMMNVEFLDEFQLSLNPVSIPSPLPSLYKDLEVSDIDHPPRYTLQYV